MARSTEVSKSLFKQASGDKRRDKEPEPLIELRQLIGRDKQMIREGIVAQAKKRHEEILFESDYMKATSPDEDTKREAEDLLINKEPTVTIVTKFNHANLTTMTEKEIKASMKDLMAGRNSTGAFKKLDRVVPLTSNNFDFKSRKGSEK